MSRDPSATLGPIARRKLSQEVQARLAEAIHEGLYPVGSPLPSERELMSLFDVGRPSIREALYALERQGMVKIVAGERARVVEPTVGHVIAELGGLARHLLRQADGPQQFEQARSFIEQAIVRHACEAASAAQVEQLRAALAANEAAIGDLPRFGSTDVAFHRALAGVAGNKVLLGMIDAVADWLIARRVPLEGDASVHNRMSYAGHLAVFEAIVARDAPAAAEAMRRHLEEAYNRYSRH